MKHKSNQWKQNLSHHSQGFGYCIFQASPGLWQCYRPGPCYVHTHSVVVKCSCLSLHVYGGVKFHRKSINPIKWNTLVFHVINIARLPDLLKTGKFQALLVWLLPLSLPCGGELVNTSCASQTDRLLSLSCRWGEKANSRQKRQSMQLY